MTSAQQHPEIRPHNHIRCRNVCKCCTAGSALLNGEYYSCKYQALIQSLQDKVHTTCFSESSVPWSAAEKCTKHVVTNLKIGRGMHVVWSVWKRQIRAERVIIYCTADMSQWPAEADKLILLIKSNRWVSDGFLKRTLHVICVTINQSTVKC